MKAALLVGMTILGACDPIWGVNARVRDPGDRLLEDVTVAIACPDGSPRRGPSARTERDGTVHVGGMGTMFPPGCDVFVAKPGYRTHRIAYAELCPQGASRCERAFSFDLVLQPE